MANDKQSRQESYLMDTMLYKHPCSVCGHLFTAKELIEDRGVWHVNPDWTITCDACDDGERNWQREIEEEARR